MILSERLKAQAAASRMAAKAARGKEAKLASRLQAECYADWAACAEVLELRAQSGGAANGLLNALARDAKLSDPTHEVYVIEITGSVRKLMMQA